MRAATNWILCEIIRVIGEGLTKETFYTLMFHLFSVTLPLVEDIGQCVVVLERLTRLGFQKVIRGYSER